MIRCDVVVLYENAPNERRTDINTESFRSMVYRDISEIPSTSLRHAYSNKRI